MQAHHAETLETPGTLAGSTMQRDQGQQRHQLETPGTPKTLRSSETRDMHQGHQGHWKHHWTPETPGRRKDGSSCVVAHRAS